MRARLSPRANLVAAVLAVALLPSLAAVPARGAVQSTGPRAVPAGARSCPGATASTIEYAAPGGVPLSMDAYAPPAGTVHPAVLVIHGGGWFTGSRTEWDPIACLLAQNGLAGFSADYRLAPAHPFPAALDDLQSAVRFLRKNAEKLGIDPARIGAVGGSAGGHLAALLAVNGSGPTDTGSRIAVAASWSGPMNLLTLLNHATQSQRTAVLEFVGCTNPKASHCRDKLLAASPATHVDRTDPPLFMANSANEAIPVSQPNAMAKVLAAKDRLYRLDVLPGSRHSARYAGDVEQPTIAFLRQYLGLASPPAIPGHGAYLGALVDPPGSLRPAAARRAVTALERSMGRTLAVDAHVHTWHAPIPGDAERFDLAAGRIPLIQWKCTDPSTITGGGQDSLIASRAASIADYGAPVLLAFGVDMDAGECAGAGPGQFQSAWRHIWTIFQAHGARNVGWVWCPSAGGFPGASRYYPGPGFVDWVCADGSSGPHPRPFTQVFSGVYSAWAGQKPLLAMTGAAVGVSPGQRSRRSCGATSAARWIRTSPRGASRRSGHWGRTRISLPPSSLTQTRGGSGGAVPGSRTPRCTASASASARTAIPVVSRPRCPRG